MMDDDEREAPAPAMVDDDTPPSRGRGLFAWFIAVAALAFAAGLIANPWFEREVRTRLPGSLQEADLGSISARLDRQAGELVQLDTRVSALEQRPVIAPTTSDSPAPAQRAVPRANPDAPPALNDPVLPQIAATIATDRLARVESRVDALDRDQTSLSGRVDNLSAEVAGLTVRVEDARGETANRVAEAERLAESARAVLLLGRARAAFESGEALGPLSPALQTALPDDAAEDVDRLTAGMRTLVAADILRARFARLRPTLTGAAADEEAGDFWNRVVGGLSDIFTIRRSGAEDPRAGNAEIVERIAVALEEGDIQLAAAEYGRLPEEVQQLGARWYRDALNYAQTATALARLEARVVDRRRAPAVVPPPPAPAGTPL